MKFRKFLSFFVSFLLLVAYTNAQSPEYKKIFLREFGLVTVPIYLDTVGERLHKNIILNRINEIPQKKLYEINNKYKFNLSKTLLENTLEGTHRFWNSSTINYFIDTALTLLSTNGSKKEIDYSKIQLIPNISLKRDNNPVSSDYVLIHVFSNKDSANTFLRLVENMMKNLKGTLSDAKIIETNSSYSLVENKYPLIKASCLYSTSDLSDYIITFYFFYKNNYRYSMKFEYSKENYIKWTQNINKFISEMKLL